MKHLFISILLTFVVSLACHGQIVTLQHNGKIVGTFSGDNKTCLAKAFEHAEDGDTLFLSKGDYFNTPTIDKSIAIIGVGASECFLWQGDKSSSNSLTIAPSSDNTISQVTIEGVTTEFLHLKAAKNFNLKKANIVDAYLGYLNDAEGSIEKATFESCKISRGAWVYSKIKYLTFRNCEIAYFDGIFTNTTLPKFINCDIISLAGSAYYGSSEIVCVNCIIGEIEHEKSTIIGKGTILINTLYQKSTDFDLSKECLMQDCYATENGLITDKESTKKLAITEEELRQNNYLGTDGTVIGKSGGARPFSQDMHLPTITKNNYVMDKNKKKVSLNVSVTAN